MSGLCLPDRRPMRLAGHDYGAPGAYFVTIVVAGRSWALGVMEDGSVRLTPAGEMTLGDVVGAFKPLSTVAYLRGVAECGWPRLRRGLWQRSYHDHVIRDDADLERVRTYMENNPLRWMEDEECSPCDSRPPA